MDITKAQRIAKNARSRKRERDAALRSMHRGMKSPPKHRAILEAFEVK